MWQTNYIIDCLQAAWPGLTCRLQPFVTQGDKTLDKPLPAIGGKGLFTAELERSLLDGEIDLAVHSLKDLPVEDSPGLAIGAITNRADVRDAVIARNGWTLATLPPGAVVGTSSTRRAAQLHALRPDLVIRSIRGNVETRIRKVMSGDYDATLLALAGLDRLGYGDKVTERLALSVMLPAAGQGALAVQCRADDQATLALLAALDDAVVRAAVTAERAFLHGVGGGCSAPVAAHAQVTTQADGASILLQALVASTDGQQIIRVTGEAPSFSTLAAVTLGERLAAQALQQGAAQLVIQKSFTENHVVPRSTPPSALSGKRIVVTRTPEQSTTLTEQLRGLGATPISLPTIQIEPLADLGPLDTALQAIATYDWLIVTSANAVTIIGERLRAAGLTSQMLRHLHIAAVGPATTDALHAYGLTPTFVPERFEGEEIVTGLHAQVGELRGLRILLPQAAIARQQLAEALTQQGALVDVIPIYQTLPAPLEASALIQLQQGVDAITFTSGSTVRNFMQGLAASNVPAAVVQNAAIACIGPQTAATAQDLGLQVDLVATEATVGGLVDALIAHFSNAHSKE